MLLVKIFFYSVGCHFVQMTVSFALQKLFSFVRSHLSIVNLRTCANSVRKSFTAPMSASLFPTFSSIRFSVSCFIFGIPFHLELSLVWSDYYGSIYNLLHANIKFDWYHLLKVVSFFQISLSIIKCP